METCGEILARAGLELVEGAGGLALTDGTMAVRADFDRMKPRLKPANLSRELLVRAAKLKGAGGGADGSVGARTSAGGGALRAVDATAGLGDDSLLLAAAGFDVVLFERNPIIAALLADALSRAARDPELAPIAARMRLVQGESTEALPHLGFNPDIVLLDPMFPGKRKGAAAKKKLQLLQKLERPCDDEAALLEAALAAGPRKVVVKRPAKGPQLAGRAPSYSLAGKAIRYDIIVPSRTHEQGTCLALMRRE